LALRLASALRALGGISEAIQGEFWGTHHKSCAEFHAESAGFAWVEKVEKKKRPAKLTYINIGTTH
jgi:hypothetical protein